MGVHIILAVCCCWRGSFFFLHLCMLPGPGDWPKANRQGYQACQGGWCWLRLRVLVLGRSLTTSPHSSVAPKPYSMPGANLFVGIALCQTCVNAPTLRLRTRAQTKSLRCMYHPRVFGDPVLCPHRKLLSEPQYGVSASTNLQNCIYIISTKIQQEFGRRWGEKSVT